MANIRYAKRGFALAVAAWLAFYISIGQPRSACAAIEEFYLVNETTGQLFALENIGDNLGFVRIPLGNVSALGGTSSSGGTVGGTIAGSSVLGSIGILAGAGVLAALTVVAIDRYQNGNFIWTAVNDAGGLSAVLGTSPSSSAAPIPGATTVSCADPTPLQTQCQASSLRNSITRYYSWFAGSWWTCGEIWDSGATTGSAEWTAALAMCNGLVNLCVAKTANVCLLNAVARADVTTVAVPPSDAGPPNTLMCSADTSATSGGCAQQIPGQPCQNGGVCGSSGLTGSDGNEGCMCYSTNVVIEGSQLTTAAINCNGDQNTNCDAAFEPSTGVAYDTGIVAGTPVACTDSTVCRANETCVNGTCTYTFNGWADVLRVLLAGFDHNAGNNYAQRDCASPIRMALANSFGNFFENHCAAEEGDTTGGVCTKIRHVFRPDDFSLVTATLVELLGLPEIVNPEESVQVFVNGTYANITEHTGANPFCNSVRPGFVFPQGPPPTAPEPTCLQGSDATWDATSLNPAPSCPNENAVYRSTMQDNDPIRRTCFGSATGAVGTAAEDNCSHSGDLGLVLVANNVPEPGDRNGYPLPTSDPLRYNSNPCSRSKFVSATPPEVYDAMTQTRVICARGLLCPNGDICTTTGACIVPADPSGNPQCLGSKLTAPPVTLSQKAVPLAHPLPPAIVEGRVYNQHLYKLVGSAAAYQTDGFTTPLPMTGAFYRIHTNHSMNPASTTAAPIVCQFPDMSEPVGVFGQREPLQPCGVGYRTPIVRRVHRWAKNQRSEPTSSVHV